MQTIDEVKKHCREVGEGIAAALTAGDVFSVKVARFVDEYADFVCRCHIRAKNEMKAGIAPRQQRRLLRLPMTPILPFVSNIIAYFPQKRKGVDVAKDVLLEIPLCAHGCSKFTKTKARIAPRLRQESFPRADDSSSRLCRSSLYHNLPLRRKRVSVDFNGFEDGKITRFQAIRKDCCGRRGVPTLPAVLNVV